MAAPLALAHDYLTQRGGAERVVAAWCRGFPDAPLYTALYDPAHTFATFAHHDVRASVLNSVAPLRQHHRYALPLLAPVMGSWRIDADTVLASSSGWAHGVRTSGRLLVYCHAPARWLYQRDRYLREGHGRHAATALGPLAPWLRRWDQRAAHRAHGYLANSTFTAAALRTLYGIEAPVVPPPVEIPAARPTPGAPIDVLTVARLLPYKNLDLVLAAAAALPTLRFCVIGEGPLRDALEQRRPPNVELRGAVDDDELWSAYASARVLLALSHEDFGLTPLEAAACGVPTVARAYGGYLDTITDETGVLIPEDDVTADAVVDAVRRALASPWDTARLRDHAAAYGPERHLGAIRAALSELPPR